MKRIPISVAFTLSLMVLVSCGNGHEPTPTPPPPPANGGSMTIVGDSIAPWRDMPNGTEVAYEEFND